MKQKMCNSKVNQIALAVTWGFRGKRNDINEV